MRVVERRRAAIVAVCFVPELDEEFADLEMAQERGQVEVGVGIACGCVVGVVQEVGVGFEDASDEEGVVCADCAAETEGGVNPTSSVLIAGVWG